MRTRSLTRPARGADRVELQDESLDSLPVASDPASADSKRDPDKTQVERKGIRQT
jgi:hypothetical protein